MLQLLRQYCITLFPHAPALFFAVGGYLALLFGGILLLDPYRKQRQELLRTKKWLAKRRKKQNCITAPLPAHFREGWEIFCNANGATPSKCLPFRYKKGFFLFDCVGLTAIFATLPLSVMAGSNQSFGWQFFVPLFFAAVFLVIFQTHRLLLHLRAEKTKKVHLACLDLLDALLKRGYRPADTGAKQRNRLILALTDATQDSLHINNGMVAPLPTTAPQNGIDGHKIDYLVKKGVKGVDAQEIADTLAKSPFCANRQEQKRLNALLEDSFKTVCKPKDAQ